MPLLTTGAGAYRAAGSTVVTDDFNRSNENLEASANWTRVDGAAGAAKVVSNALDHTTTTNSAYYHNGLNSVNAYSQLVFGSNTVVSTFPVAARVSDSNNFVGVRYAQTTGLAGWELYKRVAGTFTSLARYEDATASGKTCRLEVSGDNARVLIDSVERIGWTALGGDLSTNSRCGTIVRNSMTGYDNFEAGSL